MKQATLRNDGPTTLKSGDRLKYLVMAEGGVFLGK